MFAKCKIIELANGTHTIILSLIMNYFKMVIIDFFLLHFRMLIKIYFPQNYHNLVIFDPLSPSL